MLKISFLIVLGSIFISCSNSEKLKIEYCEDFNYEFIDSLARRNPCIMQSLEVHSAYLLYVTDGSCSECIYNLVNFVKDKKGISIPCVYIINAQDFVLFDFYTNKNELEKFLGNDLIMKFTFDLFHAIEPETYAGNQLLIVDNKNTKIISLPLNPFVNDDTVSDFLKLIDSVN